MGVHWSTVMQKQRHHPKQQQQWQILATSAGSVETGYASQPVQTTSMISYSYYRHRQSAIIGILLVVAGSLNIIVNFAVISDDPKQSMSSTAVISIIIYGLMVSSN